MSGDSQCPTLHDLLSSRDAIETTRFRVVTNGEETADFLFPFMQTPVRFLDGTDCSKCQRTRDYGIKEGGSSSPRSYFLKMSQRFSIPRRG